MRDVLDVVERMAGTIDHLRIFSRDTSEEPGVRFSVNDAINGALKMIQSQLANHGIALDLDLSGGVLPAMGHPHQMEQVFVNLLSNARDALDEKEEGEGSFEKRIAIRTRVEKHDNWWVVAEVKDNGVGMDEEACQQVFEPFFTTKEAARGTGLGLSISYAIVQNHEGTISCESCEGEGTTFRVAVPAAESRA